MAKDKSKKSKPAEDPWGPAEDEAPKAKKGTGGRGTMEDAGTGGGSFSAEELSGKLLLIWPTSLEEGVTTSYGDVDATKADIVVLDEKKVEKSDTIDGALIFQKVLQSQLRGPMVKGNCVLGRLFQDTESQKKGQSAPWRLATPTAADREVGQAYLDTTNPLVGA